MNARISESCIVIGRLIVATAAGSLIWSAYGLASAASLRDGTPVRVRLVGTINSETTRKGQPLRFVVTQNVVSSGEIVIDRGTAVGGIVVDARRSRWGFQHDHPKLAFKFTYTVAIDGRLIALRASSIRGDDDHVAIDRKGGRHELQWAGDADVFEAYVDGDYAIDSPDRAGGSQSED